MKRYQKAVLVVSFGSSLLPAFQHIQAIEADIKAAYPFYMHYHAWTCQRIIDTIWDSLHVKVNTLADAMEQMYQDGITDVIVQPTYIINGNENAQLKDILFAYQKRFSSLRLGTPLLSSQNDIDYIVSSFRSEFSGISNSTALILMGHGSSSANNDSYRHLHQSFQEQSSPVILLGTLENKKAVSEMLPVLKEKNIQEVILTPFLITAGIHAAHNMAGMHASSWKTQLETAGFKVSCLMKGLGEYPFIRSLFIEHIKNQELSD